MYVVYVSEANYSIAGIPKEIIWMDVFYRQLAAFPCKLRVSRMLWSQGQSDLPTLYK
jgi:hypothetical protein